jgi:hypothetical protein
MTERVKFHWVLAGACLLAAATAQARNLKLTQPLEPALRSVEGQLASFKLQFGSASAQGLQSLAPISARGIGEPYTVNPSHNGPAANRRTDAEMCEEGFRKAAAELQKRAQPAGAIAVVGITSFYGNTETNSAQVYECRVGMSRAVVELKGHAVRSLERAAAVPQAVATPVPAPAVATTQARRHTVTVPASAGYAAIHESAKVPYQTDGGRAYGDWLLKPTPRAYAVHPNGSSGSSSGSGDAVETALRKCEERAQGACFLYAVDEQVVWSPDPARRVTLKSLAR